MLKRLEQDTRLELNEINMRTIGCCVYDEQLAENFINVLSNNTNEMNLKTLVMKTTLHLVMYC